MDPVYRTVIAISLVITAAAAAIALYRLYRSTMDEEKAMKEKDSAYTTADYRADLRCEICFDDIGDEPVSQCGKCGKTFHLSCAEPTGECPYCGTRFEDFLPPRPPRHVTCPRCGNPMNGNICSCGTVIPDADGSFVCRCGERVSKGEGMCRRCGRTFRTVMSSVKKQYIPRE